MLETSLTTTILDTLFVRLLEIVVGTPISGGGGARNHDILAAFMTILITQNTTKLILPSCLRTNEQIRLFALSTVCKNLTPSYGSNFSKETNLRQTAFKCYNGGTLFYISDDERSLVTRLVGTCLASNSPNLTYLSLEGIATNETIQALVTNVPGCPKLQYLCFSQNKVYVLEYYLIIFIM